LRSAIQIPPTHHSTDEGDWFTEFKSQLASDFEDSEVQAVKLASESNGECEWSILEEEMIGIFSDGAYKCENGFSDIPDS